MDHGGAGGMARARSKAWIAATQQIPSVEHLGRMRMIPPPMVSGFTVCSPEAIFPGAGGMPIRAEDEAGEPVIAGIAASGAGIGPFVGYPGSDPEKLIADGRPSNGEDLLVHYALGIPYEGQHGDDLERWINAYGSFPDEPGQGSRDGAGTRGRAQDEHGGHWRSPTASMAAADDAGSAHIARHRRSPRRPDPARSDGRRRRRVSPSSPRQSL